MTEHLAPEAQRRVDDLLRWGVVFSIFWLMGVGSLIAVVCGIKAKRIVEMAGAKPPGRVWWCLIVGTLGLAVWIPMVLIGIVNNLRAH
jgi:formate-dependent nitrite reductase membrane component NrfD